MKKVLKIVGIIVAVLMLVGIVSNLIKGSDKDTETKDTAKSTQVEEKADTQKQEEAKQEEQKAEEPKLTRSQENAIRSAERYLNVMAFSRTGLIKQLVYEKYPEADATFAVDNIKVDWNEQAYKSAKNYLKTMSFSEAELVDQLKYEGFTPEQATSGAHRAYSE